MEAGRGKRLQKELEFMEKKYMELFAQKSELEYRLCSLREQEEHRRRQDGEIRSLHQSVRQLKHDMKNHLMVLASYLNNENYEEARNYTSDILDKLNAMHGYIETGNSLMNHILNEKIGYARERNIAVKAEIENLSFSRLKSIDFSSLLSNLLDNAIEASLKEGEILPEIHISIKRSHGYECICVKNKIGRSVLTENPKLFSTKKEGGFHGIGISRIKEIVADYEGLYECYEEGSFFCSNIFLPVNIYP